MRLSSYSLLFVLIVIIFQACSQEKRTDRRQITKVNETIVIDGLPEEKIWSSLPWSLLNHTWLGEAYSNKDFSGRYKITWDEEQLYILAEIIDDTLIDTHIDALKKYWDDDCLEIFIDEDGSKGDHQYTHNAFAYHVSLTGQVVDIGLDKQAHFYDHVKAVRKTTGNKTIREASVKLYNDQYNEGRVQQPERLHENKMIGFALAYCDNDYSEERENFIGSIAVEGEDKNRGWIDAGIFEPCILIK